MTAQNDSRAMLREMAAAGDQWARDYLADLAAADRLALAPERKTGLEAAILRQKRKDAGKHAAAQAARAERRAEQAREAELVLVTGLMRAAAVAHPLITIVPDAHLERAAVDLLWTRFVATGSSKERS